VIAIEMRTSTFRGSGFRQSEARVTDLTQSQKAAIAAESLPLLKEEARLRRFSNLTHAKDTIVDGMNSYRRGRVREIIAKEVGVGASTVWEAEQVKKADPGSTSNQGHFREIAAKHIGVGVGTFGKRLIKKKEDSDHEEDRSSTTSNLNRW
jgi:hypothetical protein